MERFNAGFQRLFEVRLLHHYWLDDGETIFDQQDEKKRDSRLQNYDMRVFLQVRPTQRTANLLFANKCLFRETALGFHVAAPADGKIAADASFDFILAVRDQRFFEYTALTLRPQKIREIYSAFGKKIFRYKENVPLLTNVSGAKRNDALFLCREYPSAADDLVESFYVDSHGALMQLISENQGAAAQKLSERASDFPLFLHQGDIPDVISPAGFPAVAAKGVALSEDVTDDVFALLSLKALRPDDDAFSFVDATGKGKPSPPVYQLRFKSRSTYWKYLNGSTGEEISTEANPLPLTFFGNASEGKKQKPSGLLVKAEKKDDRISRLFSEIRIQ